MGRWEKGVGEGQKERVTNGVETERLRRWLVPIPRHNTQITMPSHRPTANYYGVLEDL